MVTIKVENPRLRLPVYLIIDDGVPLYLRDLITWGNKKPPDLVQYRLAKKQFSGKTRYTEADRFLTALTDITAKNGIKGKLSVVPYVPEIGLLDRLSPECPEKPAVEKFLETVRNKLMDSFDITPEMLTHDRTFDLETKNLLNEKEWLWCDNQSAKTLEEYIALALQVLKNCGLNPNGVTSPNDFGTRIENRYVSALLNATKKVCGRSFAWYFLNAAGNGFPRLMYLNRARKEAVMSVVDIISDIGLRRKNGDGLGSNVDAFLGADGKSGYLAELAESGSPLPLCMHWWLMYSNGKLTGLKILDRIAGRINRIYGKRAVWMKCSELAEYYAAANTFRSHYRSDANRTTIEIDTPFPCRDFTIRLTGLPAIGKAEIFREKGYREMALRESRSHPGDVLPSNSWRQDNNTTCVCFDARDKTILKLQ